MMMMNLVKAASGLLRCGAARLLLAAAMSIAAWAQLRWVLQRMAGDIFAPESAYVMFPMLAALWLVAVVIAAAGSLIDEACESGVSGLAAVSRVSRRLPFVMWANLTRGERVEVWMALLWILLWPAEVLACLAVALWAIVAGTAAAGRLALWHRPRS
jgi:hypothetical protein